MERPRIAAALLAASLLVLATTAAGGERAGAIEGGNNASDMAASVVRITYDGIQRCTGSVVGDGWVLTAHHCLGGRNFDWRKLRVQIWRNGVVGGAQVYRSPLTGMPIGRYGSTDPGEYDAGYSDMVLMQTATAMPAWVKTIPMALTWPAIGTGLTQYGYGRVSRRGPSSDAMLKTPDRDLRRVSCSDVASNITWRSGHICARGTRSTAWEGDSGGPLLWWVNGNWQQVGDFSVYPRGTSRVHWQGYWSEVDGSTRAWIASHVTGTISPNTILRDAYGASWLYQSDGYRHWIPTAAVYNCLTARGTPVNSGWPLRRIETIPDWGGSSGWATCTPPPPPPPTWREQETPNRPVNTFTNYHNASGMGTPVAAGQWVEVSCRVYDPTIASSNPDGWWYRIHSSPWNDRYYATANTFMNGDPYGGPYTHNTDFNVAVC